MLHFVGPLGTEPPGPLQFARDGPRMLESPQSISRPLSTRHM